MNNILLFLTILSYAVVVSQSFMYILSLENTQRALNGAAYTQVRQLIDANMNTTFRVVMYGTMFFNLLYVILSLGTVTISLITSAISLVALVIDGMLTLRGNVPINQIINSWSPTDVPANWKEVRQSWFRVFRWRQVINIAGFVSLLAGVVFA